MRAKILSSTSTFNGVSYNTHKAHNSKGELMKIKNFGYLQAVEGITPDELKSYLKAHSKRNTRVKNKQFHAMISCKGREFDKKQLTNIAEKWLLKMGYGDNPYLIVFHSDTKNNHVHMVTTRIGKDGKKIKDSMEKIKAQIFINEIMKKNPKKDCVEAISKLKSYSFSTVNQAKLFFEVSGYRIADDKETLKFYKYGLLQGEIPLSQITNQVKRYSSNKKKVMQLRALLIKYNNIYGCSPTPVFEPLKGERIGKHVGYSSDLSTFLKEKFEIEIIFHGKEKTPYGYTIIDRAGKSIFKGSEIISLKDLLVNKTKSKVNEIKISRESDIEAYYSAIGGKYTDFKFEFFVNKEEYRLKLLACLEEYPTITGGLESFKLKVYKYNNELYLLDKQNHFFVSLNSILDAGDYRRFASSLQRTVFPERENPFNTTSSVAASETFLEQIEYDATIKDDPKNLWEEKLMNGAAANLTLNIGQDVNDEETHGRERKKVKKTGRKIKRN